MVYMDTVLFPFLFNGSIQYISVFLNKTFFVIVHIFTFLGMARPSHGAQGKYQYLLWEEDASQQEVFYSR